MSTPLTARILEDYDGAARRQPGGATPRRRAAIEALAAAGLPTSRDENWKYASLRMLERQRFAPAAVAEPPHPPAELPAPLTGAARYVFVDGVPLPSVSQPPLSGSAQLTPLDDPAAEVPRHTPRGDARFALLNQAFATDGLAIRVPAGSAEPVQLELLFVASAAAERGASYPSVTVRLEPHARMVLIERHVSAAAVGSFVSAAVTVDLARGAQLEHCRLQELNTRSILFDTLSANLAEEARYRLQGVSTGAQAARSTLGVRLGGERAELTLAWAALGERQQVLDTYALVEHAAANARTEQIFRGIAAGRARVACNGKIVVASSARGTDSRQSLRGLLAGPEAEIDVRPQLEIYTDDVRCSHGATAGKLDDDMLFYLLSRGLDHEGAQRLLKWAFLEDAIAKIAPPRLRRQIEERLAAALHDDTLRELL
ncbi:MAG TPA: Fe-S cluster assembly protein SufD [Steroidobacteraceae bacterium]|nr:Fe-S cluster assembly protein SufD [Steroidobacteraceae bacterium]